MELHHALLENIQEFILEAFESAHQSNPELSPLYSALNLDELESNAEYIHNTLTAVSGEPNILLNSYQALKLKIFLMLLVSSSPSSVACMKPLDMITIVCGPRELVLKIVDCLNKELTPVFPPLPYSPSSIAVELKCPSPLAYSSISLEEFISTPSVPKIIRGLIDHWPAMSKWLNPNYFLNTMGHRLVPVELGRSYLDSDWTQRIMSVEEFLRDYICNESPSGLAYLAQYDLLSVIPSLQSDVDDLDFCDIELPGGQGGVLRNIWIGMKNCYTPPHFDKYYNMFCQVVGQKHIRIFPPDTFGPSEVQGNTLRVNLGSVLDEPRVSEKMVELYLNPGEVLYVPKDWWHEVRSLSSYTVSVSHWF